MSSTAVTWTSRLPGRLAASLYALMFVASVAQTALVPLLPRLAEVDGLSTATTAALIAAPGAATLAVALPSGAFADRFGARRVTVGAGILLATGMLAQGVPGTGWLLSGRLAFGIGYGIAWTTAVAWISQHERDRDASSRQQAAVVTSAAAGVAAGPGLGALLAAHAGVAAPFVVAGLAAAAVTLVLGTTATREATVAPTRPETAQSLATLTRAGRRLAGGALALALSGATNGALQLLVPMQLHRTGASSETIGLAFSCAAGLYIAVSACVARAGRRAATPRMNALAALLLAAALVPAASSGAAVAVLATLVLTVAPRATLSTIAYPLATTDAARAGLGHGLAIGLLNGAWAAAIFATPLAAGAVSQWAGTQAAWQATLALGMITAAWLAHHSAARAEGRVRGLPAARR